VIRLLFNITKGGFELSPVLGHLGDSEPMVKPTWNMVGFRFERRCVFVDHSSTSMKNMIKGGN
jgi:hypothetical protein